jgi:DNA-directed RNA polymerase subunit M
VVRIMAKRCPRCGSKDLNQKPWLGELYECRECGYQGALVVEDGELADALGKKLKLEEEE